MNQTAHNCPACDDEMLCDDSDHPDLLFECPSCGARYHGHADGASTYVDGPIGH